MQIQTYSNEKVDALLTGKQATLVSGTNIKTINNQSLLGSGNIDVSGGGGTVDTEMSDSSTNAVQNKVIKAYVDKVIKVISKAEYDALPAATKMNGTIWVII